MNPYLASHPEFADAVRIILGVLLFPTTFLDIFLLPFYLNKRFDPYFGPKPGESWEIGKSPAFPYYMVHKAYDYANALLFEDFAKKKFSSSRDFFREKVSRFFILICWYAKASRWLLMAYVLVLAIFAFVTRGTAA